MTKVICLNSKNKPNEIPTNVWNKLIEGEWYTITKVVKCNIQGGIYGYELAEIDLKPYTPYEYFAAYRFGIPVPDDKKEEIEELIEIT